MVDIEVLLRGRKSRHIVLCRGIPLFGAALVRDREMERENGEMQRFYFVSCVRSFFVAAKV